MVEITIRQAQVRGIKVGELAPPFYVSRFKPDAGGRLIDQRPALAAVFGRPLQNLQEIVRCFPICNALPRSDRSLLQMRSESGTHHTLATR